MGNYNSLRSLATVAMLGLAACGNEKTSYNIPMNTNADLTCRSIGKATIVSRVSRDDPNQLFSVPIRYTDEDGDGRVDYYILGPTTGMLVADPDDTSLDYMGRNLVAQGRYIKRNSETGRSIQSWFDKAACNNVSVGEK